MRLASIVAIITALAVVTPGRAVSHPTVAKAVTAPTARASNAEMSRMFATDQAARQNPAKIDWSILGAEDAARLKRTRALLDAGALDTGEDYYHAAFIFQHGGKPDDYLLAHALAVASAARGHPQAAWIAAATLDRYLQTVGQKQVFGTQFKTMPGTPTTQEPYDRTLVPDTLRTASGVPVLAEQETRRQMFQKMFEAREKK